MSERYAVCRTCVGTGQHKENPSEWYCGRCGGTGISGDVMDRLDPLYALRAPKRPPKSQPRTRAELMHVAIASIAHNKKGSRK